MRIGGYTWGPTIYEVNNDQVKDVQGTHYDNVAMGQRFLREYNYMANILFVTLLSVFGSLYKIRKQNEN